MAKTSAPRLEMLFTALDKFGEAVPLDSLVRLLHESELTVDDVRQYVQFGQKCYRRNLIRVGSAYHYHALALCWQSGQRSPIHDHRGSACAVKVLAGTATETVFGWSPSGLLYPTTSCERSVGDICGSFDADIHQMGNLQSAGAELVTLHIYSPPLLQMQTYYLGDSVLGDKPNALFNSAPARQAEPVQLARRAAAGHSSRPPTARRRKAIRS